MISSSPTAGFYRFLHRCPVEATKPVGARSRPMKTVDLMKDVGLTGNQMKAAITG
jgi:hypothetical protein